MSDARALIGAASSTTAEENSERAEGARASVAAVVSEIEGSGVATEAIEDEQTMIAGSVSQQATTTTELSAHVTRAAASTVAGRSALHENWHH